jgi:uncharacterized phage infection (PIP) family protein YhgE
LSDWFSKAWNASDNEQIFRGWHQRLSQCVPTLNLGLDIQQFNDRSAELEAAKQDAEQIKKLISSLSAQSSNQHSSMKAQVQNIDSQIEHKHSSMKHHVADIDHKIERKHHSIKSRVANVNEKIENVDSKIEKKFESLYRHLDEMKTNSNNSNINTNGQNSFYPTPPSHPRPATLPRTNSSRSHAIIIPYTDLRFDKLVGQGSFGNVW